MPMIVDPSAPEVTAPARVTSPDGWFAAIVDETWAGVVLSVDYTAGAALAGAADVRQVRLVRQDLGAAAPVPVRSGDAAWAIEGVGTAYDHEAPLGAAVIYTATAIYEDGSSGPSSSLAVTVPAPEPGEDDDLWLKSLDTPALSARVMIVDWPGMSSAGRVDAVDVAGSPYRATAYDTHGAPTIAVTIDVTGATKIERVRKLLVDGVLLAQVRPDYLYADRYFVVGDWSEKPTGKLGIDDPSMQYTFTIEPIERPATAGQPMRLPSWSWDSLAELFADWNALASSYSSWASLSTNGVT
ncbi:hypothetical protein [Streptomyces caniferus]|uniref:hypothetical protein n=1 Tax=Streptomyces caniferus TaxID=285557 RepID=UPI00381570DE